MVDSTRKAVHDCAIRQCCAIYCQSKTVDAESIVALAGSGAKVEIKGEASNWTSVAIRRPGSQLVLARTVFTGPGFSGPQGRFNSAVLGAGNYFKNVKTADVTTRKKLVADISRTETLIGCVAKPRMAEGDYGIIFEIARRFGGMIFDSDAMLDADGVVLLDADGKQGYHRERDA